MRCHRFALAISLVITLSRVAPQSRQRHPPRSGQVCPAFCMTNLAHVCLCRHTLVGTTVSAPCPSGYSHCHKPGQTSGWPATVRLGRSAGYRPPATASESPGHGVGQSAQVTDAGERDLREKHRQEDGHGTAELLRTGRRGRGVVFEPPVPGGVLAVRPDGAWRREPGPAVAFQPCSHTMHFRQSTSTELARIGADLASSAVSKRALHQFSRSSRVARTPRPCLQYGQSP